MPARKRRRDGGESQVRSGRRFGGQADQLGAVLPETFGEDLIPRLAAGLQHLLVLDVLASEPGGFV